MPSRHQGVRRVAIIHQGFIPPYRVRFYELLNQIHGYEYVVFHGSAPSRSGHQAAPGPFAFPNLAVRNRELSLCGHSLIYQPLIRRVLLGPFDAVVLGHEVKFISNIVLWALCRLLRRPVLWWGHGFEKQRDGKTALVTRLLAKAKTWLARQSEMYLVYTDGGAQRLKAVDMPPQRITVVNNTLDMETQIALHERYQAVNPMTLRAELGFQPHSLILMYVGRLYREKRIDELIRLVAELNVPNSAQPSVECVIIGDGPESERLRAMARTLPSVRFTGAIYDQDLIARYLRIAAAVVIPGKVGLAVNHAFAHGVPVITRESPLHAPEVEYIQSGSNGLVVAGDFNQFVRTVATLLSEPGQLQKLQAGALQSRERLSLGHMVRAFHAALVRVLDGDQASESYL